jgi:TetR/AcrR family transcriptional regulator, cholesterol catabolism regulator
MARPAAAPSRAAPEPDALPHGQRERRDRIVRTAIDLLGDREYEQIQIKDVADHAEVALATLYRYFSSKEHLYAAALLEWSSRASRSGSRGDDPNTDADRIRAILLRAIRAFGRRPQFLRAELALAGTHDPNARKLFDQFSDRYVDRMGEALHDVPPERTDAVIEIIYSVLALRLQSWARGRCSIKDVERAVSRTIDLVLPPAGH